MFDAKLKIILDSIDVTIEKAVQLATIAIAAESTERIFNKGQDKAGQAIGRYSEAYKERRKKKGLQTGFVDLTFTTTLNKSIVNNENQVYFKNEYGRKVSGYNETTYKKRIFAPTEKEKELALEIINEELKKLWKS
jgi:hypothetical protein